MFVRLSTDLGLCPYAAVSIIGNSPYRKDARVGCPHDLWRARGRGRPACPGLRGPAARCGGSAGPAHVPPLQGSRRHSGGNRRARRLRGRPRAERRSRDPDSPRPGHDPLPGSLRHFPFDSAEACMEAVSQIAAEGSYRGHKADFVDGTAFAPDELYLTVGAYSDVAPWRSDYTGQQIYYQSVRRDKEDFLTIRDYLWRWDTDWFWCSRPFGVQKPLVRTLWPRRYRRSDVYRKLVALDRRYGLTGALTRNRNLPSREAVIQDVEIPVERGAEFLRYFAANVGMSPVWMCPLRLRGERSWPLYPLKPGEGYVNFGFWGKIGRASCRERV